MKNLIKEICKREGKKSQVKIGDVREIMARLTDILTDEAFADLAEEFNKHLNKKWKSQKGAKK